MCKGHQRHQLSVQIQKWSGQRRRYEQKFNELAFLDQLLFKVGWKIHGNKSQKWE